MLPVPRYCYFTGHNMYQYLVTGVGLYFLSFANAQVFLKKCSAFGEGVCVWNRTLFGPNDVV